MIDDWLLEKSNRLLADYSKFIDLTLINYRSLLSEFKELPDYLNILEIQLIKAKKLIDEFNLGKVNTFDPFRIAGFVANEDNFSDAIAAILDPRRSHGLGVRPLKFILKNTLHQMPVRIQAILKALEESKGYHVQTRARRIDCVLDIIISSDKFIIYIENKMRGGTETYVSGESQTVRQKIDLRESAKFRNIPWLGIFLTPEGKPAVDKEFLPISAGQLVSAIREALDDINFKDNRTSIEAFLNFYSWTN